MKTLNYGDMPTRAEFDDHFFRETTGGVYKITHGSESRRPNERPSSGLLTCSELWDECQRLNRYGSEESMAWVSDILYTLAIEWI